MMEVDAILLLSGGTDSAVMLNQVLAAGRSPHCIFFNYGQAHNLERTAAQRIAIRAGVVLERINIANNITGESCLNPEKPPDASPVVPGRNTIFLSYALNRALQLGVTDIFIGVTADDYREFLDCRETYLGSFQEVARCASGKQINIKAPFVDMTKEEVIAIGLENGTSFEKTLSCYRPDADGRQCGKCPACKLRAKSFKANGIKDPAPKRGISLV